MAYYVYILHCADDTFYTGVTNDLDRRLLEHTSGYNKESYTHSRRPIELKWYCSFTRIETAIEQEKRIKKWSKAKKQALIDSDWERISQLAKKHFKK